MPIDFATTVNAPEEAESTADSMPGGMGFQDFFNWMMGNPNFGSWLQTMLRNMGYTVLEPGTPAPATTTTNQSDTSLAADRSKSVDPFGSNWAQGMNATVGQAYERPKSDTHAGGGAPTQPSVLF